MGATYAAISTQQGPKICKPVIVLNLAPARFVVCRLVRRRKRWTIGTSPWFLTLQHRREDSFRPNGLHFTFRRSRLRGADANVLLLQTRTARAQSLPFLPYEGNKSACSRGNWRLALPADPLPRARYWSSALREFPIQCERASRDRAHDQRDVRQPFMAVVDDDWNTSILKCAISPALALAYKEGFPVQFFEAAFAWIPHSTAFYGVGGLLRDDIARAAFR